MNNHRPWRNGLTEPGILDEPLDDPALQRDSARALLDEATRKIDAVLALHPPMTPDGWRGAKFCNSCRDSFPCATVRALAGDAA